MVSGFNHTIPGVIASWNTAVKYQNHRIYDMLDMLKTIYYVVVVFAVGYVMYVLWWSYHRLVDVIKFEVLTIDTPKDLYEN